MRKLLYVPILHSPADLGSIAGDVAKRGEAMMGREKWDRHLRAVDSFWDSIEDYFRSIKDPDKLKIFQDSFVACGNDAEKMVDAAAARGSRNYAVVRDLLSRGAKIMQTEDLALVKREAVCISNLAKSKNLIEKLVAYLRYMSSKEGLLEERDGFIAKAINESLQEGETGVLFIGAFHNVMPKLAADIEVTELKEKEKVAGYQKIYYLKAKGEEIAELSGYLASPAKEGALK